MAEGHIIRNFDELAGKNGLRRDALSVAEAGLRAIDTAEVLRTTVHFEQGHLCINGEVCTLQAPERIFVVAIGKCAGVGAATLEEMLGDRLAGGIVLDVAVSDACRASIRTMECFVGTHPIPSQRNIEATGKILSLLSGLTERDAVIVLVSGGGSTLLCQPHAGVTCDDESVVFKELTHRGAAIGELNIVRKHLSLARGGFLATAAYPAQVIGLIFSDVPGGDLSSVSSGPTVYDETTVDDARGILDKYGIAYRPEYFIETPKDKSYFKRVQNVLVVDNARALKAMKVEGEKRGYMSRIVTETLSGEARDAARTIAEALHAAPAGSLLLYGGETTVTIDDARASDGGRNLECAIAALPLVARSEIIVPLASDGRDNCDFAGGIADMMTADAADGKGLSVDDALRTHASLSFFKDAGNMIITGETGSNVSDLLIAVKC